MADQFVKIYGEAFYPETVKQIARLRAENTRFVHYTSAETGLKIIESEQMFLRNSVLMNDFSEVSHGLGCLRFAYNSHFRDRILGVLRKIQPELPEIFEQNFNNIELDLRAETYLLSISEHAGPAAPSEDQFGRLSMWRAYAKKDGVAFVLNNTPFVAETNALNAFTHPVIYAMPEDFVSYLEAIVLGLEKHVEYLGQLGGRFVHDALEEAFRFLCQSTKHPAFAEEREWRVIYSPSLLARKGELTDGQNTRVIPKIMSLGGIPQKLYQLPFRDYPDEGFIGATIPAILDRVLIGPSSDTYPIWQALTESLRAKGVADVETKVQSTGVPLRT